MAWYDFFSIIAGVDPVISAFILTSAFWLVILLIVVIAWIITSKKKKSVDVSALAALATSEPMAEDSAPNADPKEVMAILSIERVAASTALSAVKDAHKSRRISGSVADSLSNRYQARIAKIDADMKRRSGAQEYKSLADSLTQSRDRIRSEVQTLPPPPPPSSTPGIPPTAPTVPGIPSVPQAGPPRASVPPSIPSVPSAPPMTGPPSTGVPPSKPASPIPIPPKIPAVGPPTAKPTTVVPPSVAPPTISTPPLPPRPPTPPTTVAPPTTSDLVPPAVPTSVPTNVAPPPAEGDSQSISGLRMEMLRELARLKKFMSEETQ